MITTETRDKHLQHLQKLMKQGEFLKLTHEENKDADWKSYIHNLPKGTMKFLLNSHIHTLPTQNNLKLWGKRNSDKCKLCGNRDGTLHVLNGCKVSLDQGKYTWRHNNIIKYISDSVDKTKFILYSDIDQHTHNSKETIPPTILFTNLIHNIVIIHD